MNFLLNANAFYFVTGINHCSQVLLHFGAMSDKNDKKDRKADNAAAAAAAIVANKTLNKALPSKDNKKNAVYI